MGEGRTKQVEYPDTTFVRDIEDRVFQSLVVQVLNEIEGVSPAGGNLLGQLLGRGSSDPLKGISVQQEAKAHSVKIRVEVTVAYGLSIPEKCEEIQLKVADSVTQLTGLHVSCVHVVFKGVTPKAVETIPVLEAEEVS